MNIRSPRKWIAVAGAMTLAWALPATADHERDDPYQYDYARVVDVQPIVRVVTVETPVRECYQVDRVVKKRRRDRSSNVAGAAIAGGIIGGVIGNQFGSGSGRDAATAAGFIIGSSIAADSARASSSRTARRVKKPVRQCDISYETHEEERVDGYHVTYVFRGTQYRTRMRSHPGERIKVRVLVEPVSRG